MPLKVVGRMVLDRWPNNFFAETEQVAYCSSHIVPGIDFSNDPLQQGRNIEEDLAQRVADGLGLDSMPTAPKPAAPVQKMKPSPALQIIGKMKDTLQGRAIGILIADGSNGVLVKKIKRAAIEAGATVKIIEPKVGGARLAGGSVMSADGQLAGTSGCAVRRGCDKSSPRRARRRCRSRV